MSHHATPALRILACLSLVSGLAVAALAAAPPDKAPPLTLPDLHGQETSVKYAAAPVTLVNFWATWCGPCRAEMPLIDDLSKKYAGKGLQSFGIALESGEPSEVLQFVKDGKIDLSYTLLVGDDAVSEGFGGIDIVPTTFLIDRSGKVLSRHVGAMEDFEKSMGAEIDRALSKGEGAGAAPAH